MVLDNPHIFNKSHIVESIDDINNPSFTLISLNIRSLKRNIDLLKYNINNTKPSVICLQETWSHMTEGITNDNISIPEYRQTHISRKDKKGGGLIIYIKEEITDFQVINDLTFINDDIESLAVSLCHNNNKFLIVNTYRPPARLRSSYQANINNLNNIADKANTLKTNKTIVCGDFNIDMASSDNHTSEFLDTILSRGLKPAINTWTRVTQTSKTVIDNILTNEQNINAYVIETLISDHYLLAVTFPDIPQQPVKESLTETRRLFSNKNIENFALSLSEANFEPVLQNLNTIDAHNIFFQQLDIIFNRSFPLRKRKITKKTDQPWLLNHDIHIKSRNERILFRRFRSNKSDNNKRLHKAAAAELRSSIRQAKFNYFNGLFNQHKSKPWTAIKELIGKCKREVISSVIEIDGNELSDKNIIANEFNKFFNQIGVKLGQAISSTDKAEDFLPFTEDENPRFNFQQVTSNTVMKIVEKLKPKRSAGPDGIPTFLVKHIFRSIPNIVTHLVNLSLAEGILPCRLKESIIKPLYKSQCKKQITNHRPISICNSFSKIYEKTVFNQLMAHFTNNNLLNKNQFGFRPKHSTENAILSLINKIEEGLINNEHTISLFVDLSKAFDTLDHHILLKKLYLYGVKGNELNWFKDYLSDRSHSTSYLDTLSEPLTLQCGIPQGTILGPLLFIIDINDLPDNMDCFTSLFADDTACTDSHQHLDSLGNNVNQQLVKLEKWFKANKLTVNGSKTKAILFSKKKIKVEDRPKIYIDNTEIEYVNHFKFLGIRLDDQLSFKHQISHIKGKMATGNHILAMNKKLAPMSIKILIYNSLIKSHIEYGAAIWGPKVTANLLKPLVTIQKKAIRNICNTPYNSHTEMLFKKTQILKINDQIEYCTLTFCHSIFHRKAPINNLDLYSVHTNDRPLREDRLDFNINLRIYSLPKYYHPRSWNKISNSLKAETTTKVFKSNLKALLIESYANTPNCTPPCYICKT